MSWHCQIVWCVIYLDLNSGVCLSSRPSCPAWCLCVCVCGTRSINTGLMLDLFTKIVLWNRHAIVICWNSPQSVIITFRGVINSGQLFIMESFSNANKLRINIKWQYFSVILNKLQARLLVNVYTNLFISAKISIKLVLKSTFNLELAMTFISIFLMALFLRCFGYSSRPTHC